MKVYDADPSAIPRWLVIPAQARRSSRPPSSPTRAWSTGLVESTMAPRLPTSTKKKSPAAHASASLAYAEWNKLKINLHRHTRHRKLPLSEARAAPVRCRRRGGRGRWRRWRDGADRKGVGSGRGTRAARLVVEPARSRTQASIAPVASLREVCHRTVVPVQLPIGEEKAFQGVVDPSRERRSSSRRAANGTAKEEAIPADMTTAVEHAREAPIEMVAESDETLMEHFFEHGTLTDEELIGGLRAATLAGKLFPLVWYVGANNIGIPPLLDAIVALLPSPAGTSVQD